MRLVFEGASRARREARAPAELLLQAAPAAAFLKDASGRLIYVNALFERLTGNELSAIQGKTDREWLPAASAEQARAREEMVLSTGRATEAEELLPTPDGPRHFLVLRFPLRDRTGRPLLGGFAVEVTERRRAAEALLQIAAIVESSEDGIISMTPEGTIVSWNAGAERIYGYSAEEAKGKPVSFLEPPDRRGEILEGVASLTRGEKVVRFESVQVRKDGGRVEVSVALSPIRDRDGRIVAVASISRNVTGQRQAEKALRRAEAKYRDIFENAIEGIFQTTPDGRYQSANPALARMLGYESPEELIATRTDIERQHYVNPKQRTDFQRLVEEQEAVWGFEYEVYRKDGSRIWVSENARAVRDADGRLLYYEGNVEDITERRQAKELIVHNAYHDPLTGLPNRNLLMERLSLALAHARRSKRYLAVLYLDLDRFKLINDTWGHTAGDQIFQSVGRRLSGCLRESDTVARIGGDEFVVLLPEVSREEDAAATAQKLLRSIAEPFPIDGHSLRMTTSLGVALFPRDGDDAATLLRNADNAMYRAKELGRNNVQLCTEEVTAEASKRLTLQTDLRRALERGELTLHYQPMLSLVSGRIVALEALVRWQHPEKGLIFPGGFISTAEETGLILPLGSWVLRTAVQQLRNWQKKGLPDLRMAVNLSSRQFHDAALVPMVDAVLSVAEVEPRHLEIEITESVAMEDAQVTVANLLALRGRNVGISVDDFGTGYSSLSYLKKFPVTSLKIDQSFVSDMATNAADAGIVRAVVEMAHGMKLNVIAEGVETKEQFSHLRQYGCDEIQGYWFSRPQPAETVDRLLEEELERWIPRA
jgi:diguanylate cyclase (GGDEF)-like protein/PAS domain S-box-containing protein